MQIVVKRVGRGFVWIPNVNPSVTIEVYYINCLLSNNSEWRRDMAIVELKFRFRVDEPK